MENSGSGKPVAVRVAENVRMLRNERGLDLADVAVRMAELGRPLSLNGVSKVERGKRGIDVDDLVALALVLDVTPNRLLLSPEAGQQPVALAPDLPVSERAAWEWATGEHPLMPAGHYNIDKSPRFRDENRPHQPRDEWTVEQVEAREDVLAPVAAAAREAVNAGVPMVTVKSYLGLAESMWQLSSWPKPGRPRAVASVERRATAAGVVWQARWRDGQGRSRKKTFDRKTDAERHITTVRATLLSGTYVDASAGRITVAEWSARWLDAQVALKPSTRAGYAGVLRRYVLPQWGTLQLSQVQHAAVAAWVAELSARGLAPSTIRHAHRVLSMILSLAVRDGRLVRNVADRVQLPRARRAEARFLSHDEVAALADAAPAPFDVMIRLLAFTGLRFGEVAGLRIGRVDLMRRRLDVAEAISEVDGELISGEPKSHQRRTVPFPRSLVGPLTLVVAGRDADELVFPAKGGAALRNTNFRRRVFDPAVRAAGLSNLTPHDLRDTAASLAVSAGANVKAVQRMLGHASAAMTLDVYSGLFGDDLDAVADHLDAAAAASAQARVPPVCPAGSVANLSERRESR